ncbi:MAG: FAD-dependent oxidoreductase [Candidatus Rokubacteria bacterium]|nr:FAD-dependent oxidoreductase [Candidatus Rokubacteria bacterium]
MPRLPVDGRRRAERSRLHDRGPRRPARRHAARSRRVEDRRVRAAECVVVGGGPAGLAAARTAARHGARVVLVDENAELGGQYYRQVPAQFRMREAPVLGKETTEGRALIDEIRSLGVELRLDATVWGVFDQRIVTVATRDATERIEAQTLILAPGAYDRPVPFPGWTLPGVMTAGGAQNLMKGYRVLPGRRVLVAGSGPLLLVVARYLLHGGAQVVAVAEASPLRGLWRYAHRMLPHLNLVQRAYAYRRELQDAGVPLLSGHVIRRALGKTEVEHAVIGPCDDAWRPRAGSEPSYDVDAVVVGYGFLSSLELSRLAGCEHRYEPAVGGWVPVRDRNLETTVPGVFVAGDGAGVAGSAVAVAEGHWAGLGVAHRLGRLTGRAYSSEASRARGRLRHLAGFRRVMDELYRFGPGIYTLADDRVTLCRCEEITVGEALAAIRDGASHVNEVKAWTRAGMGRCQGRMCGPALAHLVARETGRSVADAGCFTPRPPAKPVPIEALANEVGPREGV